MIIQKRESKSKINLTSFFPGEEDIFIVVKKVSREIKKTIKFYSASASSTKFSLYISRQLKNQNITIDELKNNEDFALKALEMTQEMSDEEIEKSNHSQKKIEWYWLDNGIDVDNHSFEDTNGNPVKLTADFVYEYFADELIDFVIGEITKYNTEVKSLGKSTSKKSTTLSDVDSKESYKTLGEQGYISTNGTNL